MRLISSLIKVQLLSIVLVHIYSFSFSQKNEFNGYYITSEGDTIRGSFPRYKQWNYNPGKVNFMPLQTGNLVELTPSTCREFNIDNYDTYISYKGTRLTNPINISGASTVGNTDTHDTITTFLRQIAATKNYKFYEYDDKLRINLYYADDNKTITELEQKAAVINDVFCQSMTFKQQLKVLFPDDSQKEKIDDIRYTEESLASFVNRETGGNKLKKSKNKNNGLIVSGGISINSFKFNADFSYDFSSRSFSSNTVPVAGIGYLISINRNFDRMFLYPQLKVFSFKHSTTFSYSNSYYPSFTDTFESSPVASLGINAGYNILNKPDIKIAVVPGAGIAVLVKNKQTDVARNSATETKTVISSMNGMTTFVDVEALIIVKKKYVLWSCFNFPGGVTNFATITGKLTSLQFGLGYKF